MGKLLWKIAFCLVVAGPVAAETRIVVIGDSTMAWNGGGVARAMEQALGEPVDDFSVSGARFSHPFRMLVGPMDIRAQLPRLPYDWVVIAAGANDLAAECDCRACDETLTELFAASGLGQIPDFVEQVGLQGSRLLWVQYYDEPVGGGPFGACSDEFAVLDTRLDALARTSDTLHIANMSDIIDAANPDHYDRDRVHPSLEGSARIGSLIAQRLRALDPER